MTTPFRLNVALWQVPTMVVNDASLPASEAFQRETMNATSTKTIDERMDILERRLEKAASYFAGVPARNGARTVTVFAAPEYLFAANNFQHFISQADKDRLVTKLTALSNRFPDVVLFPGTIRPHPLLRRRLRQGLNARGSHRPPVRPPERNRCACRSTQAVQSRYSHDRTKGYSTEFAQDGGGSFD